MSGKIASMARNAEKNNDKLFPIFQKNLSSDTLPEFATTAHKLAGWLNSDKAYYANARHKIVDLIETAHETVRRHSGFPDQPLNISRCSNEARSWAEPFIQIVRTVVPFFPLFTEPVLQLRLRALMQTLYENIDWLLPQQTSVAPPVVTPVAS
ncbi:hypothetical protein C8Q79DRAFT_948576 [Trametes meyenii]|nr:hypothetical protein C8Q79DRAFT_948576 [Trametes meyenii]